MTHKDPIVKIIKSVLKPEYLRLRKFKFVSDFFGAELDDDTYTFKMNCVNDYTGWHGSIRIIIKYDKIEIINKFRNTDMGMYLESVGEAVVHLSDPEFDKQLTDSVRDALFYGHII